MASLRDLIGVNTDTGLAAQLQDQDRAAGMGSLARGWTSGRIGTDANALRADELGLRANGDVGGADSLRGQIDQLQQRQQIYAPEVGRVEDIGGVGDAMSWLGGAIGQNAASMLDPIAASAAIQGATRLAGMMPGGIGRGAKMLGSAAALAAPYVINQRQLAGEFGNDAARDPELMARTSATELRNAANLYGAGAGALDTVLPHMIGKQLTGAGLRQGLSAIGPGLRTLGGSAMEGGTEYLQGKGSQFTQGLLNPNRDTSGDASADLNNFAGGMAGGMGPSALGAYSDAGYRRVGNTAERLAEGVHDLAQSGMDLAGQARDAAAPYVQQAREKGEALAGQAQTNAKAWWKSGKAAAEDLQGAVTGEDGKITAGSIGAAAKEAVQDALPKQTITPEERTILTGTPPNEIIDNDDAVMDWLDANDVALVSLVDSKLREMIDDPQAQSLHAKLADAGTDPDAQTKASADAAKFLLARSEQAQLNSKINRSAGVAGQLAGALGRGVVAAGKVAAGLGSSVANGVRQGMNEGGKKNMQTVDPQGSLGAIAAGRNAVAEADTFKSWRDRYYGVRGQDTADRAIDARGKELSTQRVAAQEMSYRRASMFGEMLAAAAQEVPKAPGYNEANGAAYMREMGYEIADMAESWSAHADGKAVRGEQAKRQAPGTVLALDNMANDLRVFYGPMAEGVLHQMEGMSDPSGAPMFEHLREALVRSGTQEGRKSMEERRAHAANTLLLMLPTGRANEVLRSGKNGKSELLESMEEFSKGRADPGLRKALEEAAGGRENLNRMLEVVSGIAVPETKVGEVVDDRGAAAEIAEQDGPVLSDELDGPAPNDYERASAEKKVTKGAGRKLYGMHATANMRVDDPFAPTKKLSPEEASELELAGQSAMTRPKLFGKDTKVYIETKDIDAWNEAHPKEKAELVTLNRPNGKTEQKGRVPGMTKKVADMEAELGIARTPVRMAELMEAEGNARGAEGVHRRIEAAKPNSGATIAQRAEARADLKEAAEVFFLNRAGSHRVEAKSVRDVMKDMNMQPAKVLQLFRDYAGQESRESMGADGTGAGMLDAAADARYVIAEQVRADKENAIRERNKKRVKQGLAPEPLPTFTPYNAPELRAASARFRDKFNRANAEGRFASLERKYGKVDTTKVEENKEFMRAARARFLEEQREILMGKAEAYFADKYMAVGEQLSDQDPEKMPATDLMLLAKDGVGMLERTRGRTRNGVFEEFPDDVRQQKLIDANLIEFKDRAGKPMMIPAGKLVNWVRQQRGSEETKDYSNRAKDEAYLDDVMTGVSTIMASGFVADGAWPTMVNKEGKAESFAKGIPSSLRLATMTMGAREVGTALKRDKRGPVSDELFQGPDQEKVAADQMRQADFFTPEDRAERDMIVDDAPAQGSPSGARRYAMSTKERRALARYKTPEGQERYIAALRAKYGEGWAGRDTAPDGSQFIREGVGGQEWASRDRHGTRLPADPHEEPSDEFKASIREIAEAKYDPARTNRIANANGSQGRRRIDLGEPTAEAKRTVREEVRDPLTGVDLSRPLTADEYNYALSFTRGVKVAAGIRGRMRRNELRVKQEEFLAKLGDTPTPRAANELRPVDDRTGIAPYRVDRSGTIAAEPKTEDGDATEMDFFPKKKDGQVPGDFDDQQWLTQQTNQRFEGGPEPKGTAASRAEFRAGKITEAFLADPAKGQEMIRMRLRMAAAPGYNDGSTARKTPLLDKDGNQYQSKKGPVFDTAKAEVVGGPHYIAPLAAFISTKNLVDNNIDMGAKAIAAIRQRVASTLLGAKMENTESLKIARLMLDDPKTVTAMNYKGKLQQLVDGAPAVQAAPVAARAEPVTARVEPVAKPAAPAAPAAPKPKATTMQDLVDERIDYLRNPPKDYTPEKAQFYVDWAKKQVERIGSAIKAALDPKTGAETDESMRLLDLRQDLRQVIKEGESILRYGRELEGKMGPQGEVAAGLGKPLGGVKLTGTGVYVTKDNTKSTQATKFIGRGSARSSTAEYARQWGDKANTGNYTSADRVFVSAEGNRTGRLSPDAAEIGRATSAGATILTDGPADRAREYNAGERQVAEILTSKGYSESAPGVWNPARKLNAMAGAIHTDQGRSDFAATRTSAFAAWFGDSKVVNADGTPMVVYHGTRLDFPAFNNKDQHNKGFYFSPVPQIANQYAKDMVDGTDGGNVKPVYLSLRNPKIIEAPTKEQALANAAKGLPAFDRMQTAFVDEDDMAEYIAQGYDGLWNKAMQEIIAFHPEQIKSAVGNNGEYNPKNPDITKNAQENGGYVNNAMPPVNPRATTDAEMAAARTYATKTLGPKIKVMFREITGYSGEFIDATNTIEISTTAAAGTMGTLYHEAMHVFFRDFVKSNPKLQSVFSALVDDPKHLARLHALLDGYPAAQAQLSSGEERLAYTYQFWKAGLIQVDAKAQTWMQKVGKFFRRVLGQVRDSEHALALFEAFDQGKLAEPSVAGHVIAKQLSQGTMGIKARRQLDGLIQGLAALTMPAASVLGTSASPTARRLGKMFFTNPGEGADGRMETGLLNARRNVSQQYTNAANRLFAEMNDVDQREVQRHLQAETPLDKIADAAHQQYVQKIRGMLANFHTYMVDAGMTIGKVENNYYPTVWNAEALLGQQAEFITMLETKYADEISQAGTDPAVAARRIWQSLVSKEGVDAHLPAQREDGVLNPFFASQERRTLPFIKGEDKERFLEKNMPMTLTRYFKQGAHAAEYFRRFGKDGHKLEKSLARISDELRTASQEMVKSGVLKDEDARAKWHSRQMRDISQSVGAMEGSLGKDVSPSMRKFNSWMTVYQNVRLLPMSLFSSMVDPLALVARGAPMQAAYESFMYGMREVFRTWGDAFRDMPAKRAADEWRDLAELIGASEVAQFSHHVSEEYASTYLTHGAKKINDKMFVINGMEAWNRGSRIMATKWGVRFLEKHAALTDPHHSKRWLSELGLTPSMLTLDDGKLVTNRDQLAALKGVSVERADQLLAPVYAALNRWVEGAVLTPGAALRPAWSSDPNWASMFHLKQFSYAFHQVILKRATNEFKHGNMAPIGALAAFIPTMITADIMKGLLQGGGELPPFMKSWDAGDWFMHGVNRAGLTGIGQVGMDAAIDPASLGGPAFEQAMDALRDPAGVSLLNAAPLHSLYAQAVN